MTNAFYITMHKGAQAATDALGSIRLADIQRRELSIKGSFAQIDCFPRALDYLESGKVKVDELVTHEFPLKDYQKALELAWSRQGIKTIIIPPKN